MQTNCFLRFHTVRMPRRRLSPLKPNERAAPGLGVALSFNRKIYGSRLDKSETGFWIDKFLQMGCTFGQDYLACGPNVRLQQMTAVLGLAQ